MLSTSQYLQHEKVYEEEKHKQQIVAENIERSPEVWPKIIQGHLYKRGEIIKSWHNRYFVLLNNERLFYYEKESDFCVISQNKNRNEKIYSISVPLGYISLVHVLSVEVDSANPLCFTIITNERVYYLKASSDETMAEWIQVITKFIYFLVKFNFNHAFSSSFQKPV